MAESPDHPKVMFPPPLVFLGYLIGALAVNWALPIVTPWLLLMRVVGAIFVAAGIGLVGWTFSKLMREHTTPDSRRPTTALVVGGPYRFTRNPVYLGFLFNYLGLTLIAGTLWGILLSPLLIATITRSVIRPEEIYLAAKFPNEYTPYFLLVRRWL